MSNDNLLSLHTGAYKFIQYCIINTLLSY